MRVFGWLRGRLRPRWRLETDPELGWGWLAAASEQPPGTGFDAVGWPASIWVLNAIYEHAEYEGFEGMTHDEVLKDEIRRGEVARDPLELDERTTVIGSGLGYAEHPGEGWKRVQWGELAERLRIDFAEAEVPPCFRWFPYRSWPAELLPPSAGSLDEELLGPLLELLEAETVDGECLAYYSVVAAGLREIDGVFVGRLRDLPQLMDKPAGQRATPSNFWPRDRSWLVYTDGDLWATKVSGSERLIESIRADERLETMEWPVLSDGYG
jgi:hypothetical protein